MEYEPISMVDDNGPQMCIRDSYSTLQTIEISLTNNGKANFLSSLIKKFDNANVLTAKNFNLFYVINRYKILFVSYIMHANINHLQVTCNVSFNVLQRPKLLSDGCIPVTPFASKAESLKRRVSQVWVFYVFFYVYIIFIVMCRIVCTVFLIF